MSGLDALRPEATGRRDRYALAQAAISPAHGTICARLLAFAQIMPRHEAVRFLNVGASDDVLSYEDLVRRMQGAAAQMRASGVRPAQPVLLLYKPSIEFVVSFLACQYLGAVAVPLQVPDTAPKGQRLSAVARQMQEAAVLCGADSHATLTEAFGARAMVLSPATGPLPPPDMAATRPDDLVLVQFTSGSTGAPKGVRISAGNLTSIRDAIHASGRIDAADIVLSWLPFEHDMGMIGGLLQPLWQGARSLLMSPNSFNVRPHRWLSAMSEHGVSVTVAPDSAYLRAAQAFARRPAEGVDLSRLALCYNGAEPVKQDTMRLFSEVLQPCGFDPRAFSPCYGLAEASLLVSGVDRDVRPDGLADDLADDLGGGGPVALGAVPEAVTVRIVDPASGAPVPEAQVGEIWVAGPTVAQGYWQADDDTARVFQNRVLDHDGLFMRTGDFGMLRDGQLFVIGRLKSILLRGGTTYFAEDLERAGQGSSKPARAGRLCVVQQGDGGAVWALQEVSPSRVQGDLAAPVATALRQKINAGSGVLVDRVLLVAPGSLQWTTSGKLQRQASVDHVTAHPDLVLFDYVAPLAPAALAVLAQALHADPRDPQRLEAALCAWLARVGDTPIAEVEPDLPWADQAVDSLLGASLVSELGILCRTSLPDDLLYRCPTPADLAAFLTGLDR